MLLPLIPLLLQPAPCAADNASLKLPANFCAYVFASDLRTPRHMAVAPNGDVFVVRQNTRNDSMPGIVVLRDADKDGRAEVKEYFGPRQGGTGIALVGNALYVDARTAILRYTIPAGAMRPANDTPDTIVAGLPTGGHYSRNFAFDGRGNMYVNVGSISNVCEDRSQNPPRFPDPCTELETRAGIWRFSATQTGQRFSADKRFATGIRNAVGLAWHPTENALYATQHGRDNLGAFRDLYTTQQNAEQPAEEFMRVSEGDDFGWPYCYYDTALERRVLAPEFGGDHEKAGRCAQAKSPVVAFPGHWAPNALFFYSGNNFPARYRSGAFIAFHGSWNRAPLAQAGYNVAFAPMVNGQYTGAYEIFADGFGGANVSPQGAAHRPTGIAMLPDGTMLVADDKGGVIFGIRYTGR